MPRLKNKLGYLRAHADVIFCIACACMRTADTTLPHISNFVSHVHVFRSVHVAIARGSHSMHCHVASPQEQTRAHAAVILPHVHFSISLRQAINCRTFHTYTYTYVRHACACSCNSSSHFSISLRMSTFRCARCTGVAACVVIASPQNKFRVQTCHVGVGVTEITKGRFIQARNSS